MKFEEICDTYNNFKIIIDQKCTEYCNLNKVSKPFDNIIDIIGFSINKDSITIVYKNNKMSYFESQYLSIPKQFFDEENYIEQQKKIIELKEEKKELELKIQNIHKKLNIIQEDINNMLRLSRIYEIKKSIKFIETIKEAEIDREKLNNLEQQITIINQKLKG